MRIVYIANARIPSLTANSVQIMKMCAAFAAAGHDTTLVVPRFDTVLPNQQQLEHQYGVRLNFRIAWLRGWRTLGRLWFEKRAILHMLRGRADVYFLRNERIGAVLARMDRPVVIEVHQPPRKALDRMALRVAARAPGLRTVVFISEALRDIVMQSYPQLGAATLVVEHDGVDLQRFDDDVTPRQARAALGWSEAPLTVGYAGHLYAGRGIEVIMHLAQQFADVTFKIMGGEAAAVADTRDAINEAGLTNVELIGFVANAALPQYLHACDVLLMPYGKRVHVSGGGDTAAFASPLKMFEYMATGRLIIASRLPGVAEVLNDRNALLCTPDELPEWEAALQRAHDEQLRTQLAVQARADVEHYSWDRRVARILAAVRQ